MSSPNNPQHAGITGVVSTSENEQLLLFPDAPAVRRIQKDPEETSPAMEAPSSGQQLELFSEQNVPMVAIECAITDAEFGEAARLREKLVADYGSSGVGGDLDFLDDLVGCRWDSIDLDAALGAWHSAQARIVTDSRRRQVTIAFFKRLISCREPDEIVQRDSSCLLGLVNALTKCKQSEKARLLVRDALLRGIEIPPKSVDDPDLRELLAEDAKPQWLPSLGAFEAIWRIPEAGADDISAVERMASEPLPEVDAEKALAFWVCLRVAQMRPLGPSVYQARKHMKLLKSEFHAKYMSCVEKRFQNQFKK